MTFRAILLLSLSLATAACQRPAPPTRADASIRADCRATVEREYAAQNRGDLSRRDERDLPFAGSYDAGIVSRGLGAEFGRDERVSDCLRARGSETQPTPGISPALSPAPSSPGASLRR